MVQNTHCLFICHVSACLLQKRIVDGDDPEEDVSEELIAAAHTQLDDINKSMEMNAG